MSNETKWTKGEWFQAHRENSDGMWSTEVFDENGEVIATLAWHAVCTPSGFMTDRSANAHLIAAAPDLYDALEDARGVIQTLIDEGYAGYIDQRGRIDRALAKARGEQP